MVGICGTWGGVSLLSHLLFMTKYVMNLKVVALLKTFVLNQEHVARKNYADVLLSREVALRIIEEGTSMIKRKLCCKWVLIVQDDIDHLDHLKILVGSHDWFGNRSRIIITTTDNDLLKEHQVNTVYNIMLLYNEEAIEPFSSYAFEARSVEGNKQLSLNMVSKLSGHPSVLISLVSFLHGKDKWVDYTLARLEDMPVIEIVQKLKLGDNGVSRDFNSWLASWSGWTKMFKPYVLQMLYIWTNGWTRFVKYMNRFVYLSQENDDVEALTLYRIVDDYPQYHP